MKSFISRMCWVISILAGIIITILFGLSLRSSQASLVVGILLGLVIKSILFSESAIDAAMMIVYNGSPISSINLSPGEKVDPIQVRETEAENFLSQESDIDRESESNEEYENKESKNEKDNNDFDEATSMRYEHINTTREESPRIVTTAVHQHEQSKLWIYITHFFAENALAKIGGILLFLAAMFFVGLIYIGVGGVGKLIIGLIFGFVVYGVGIYLDRKKLTAESQICLGIGIAINYLIILAGRYYNFDGGDIIIGQASAFTFMVMNTLLVVVTGILYRSNIILVFGFILAYISPLLVGGTADSPYFVTIYASIVSVGALGLAYYINKQHKTASTGDSTISMNLLRIGCIGGIATSLMALNSFQDYRMSQIACISFISIASILCAYYSSKEDSIVSLLIVAYTSVLLALCLGSDYIGESVYLVGAFVMTLYIGTVALSYQVTSSRNSIMAVGCIGALVCMIAMPYLDDVTMWIYRLVMVACIGLISILISHKRDANSTMWYIIGSYIAIIILMIAGTQGLDNDFSSFAIYISYIATFLVLGGSTIALISRSLEKESNGGLLCTLFIPLGTTIFFLYLGLISFVLPTILFGFAIVMIALILVGDKITSTIKHMLFGGLLVYILAISGFIYTASDALSMYHTIQISSMERIFVIIISFILLVTGYHMTKKDDMESLYPVSTLMHICTILPLLHGTDFSTTLSIATIITTLGLNIAMPLIVHKKRNNIPYAVAGLLICALFVGGEIYNFDIDYNGLIYGGRSITGFIYIALASVYMVSGIMIITSNDDTTETRNTIYTYLGVSISFLAIALAFIFANNVGVLALSRISLATILIYIYSQIDDDKIYAASIIMYMIGGIKMLSIFAFISSGAYYLLAPLAAILVALIIGLYCMRERTTMSRIVYDLGYTAGIITIGAMLFMIIPHSGHGWSTIGISIFLLILSIIYSRFITGYVRHIHTGVIVLFAGYQISQVSHIFGILDASGLETLQILQYISTLCIALSAFIHYRNKAKEGIAILLVAIVLYLFSVTTFYIYDIFQNTFAISIYRGCIAYLSLHRGIAQDQIKSRTIGLYIIGLTLAKVGCYDIWYGIDSGIMRVISLMILGGLLIFISTLYSRKYGGKMTGELDPSNLRTDKKLPTL